LRGEGGMNVGRGESKRKDSPEKRTDIRFLGTKAFPREHIHGGSSFLRGEKRSQKKTRSGSSRSAQKERTRLIGRAGGTLSRGTQRSGSLKGRSYPCGWKTAWGNVRAKRGLGKRPGGRKFSWRNHHLPGGSTFRQGAH